MCKGGIYLITNTENGKVYVGSTKSFQDRVVTHRSKLRLATHPNKHLQAAFTKYGEENFIFERIEYLPEELLKERESFQITAFAATDKLSGYNIATDTVCPTRGLKQSYDKIERRAAKMRKVHKFVDPQGEYIEVTNLPQFCREHDFCYTHFQQVSCGKTKGKDSCAQGYRRYSPELLGKPFIGCKNFDGVKHRKCGILLSPEGKSYEVNGYAAFARKHGLDFRGVSALFAGKIKSCKGWKRHKG